LKSSRAASRGESSDARSAVSAFAARRSNTASSALVTLPPLWVVDRTR